MGQEQVVDEKRKNEVLSFSEIYSLLVRSRKALVKDDSKSLGFAHGALREVYNGLGELVYSKYLGCLTKARKDALKDLSDSVFNIREKLVKGTQVDGRDLSSVVSENNTYGELDDVMAALKGYVRGWYGFEISQED